MSQLPPLPQQNIVEFENDNMQPVWRQFWQNLLIYIKDQTTATTTLQGQVTTLQTYASNNPYTFTTLPVAGTIGRIAYLTDGAAALAWGDIPAAGGGTAKYRLWDNGTDWTVIGK
jgi:hypothetical protein